MIVGASAIVLVLVIALALRVLLKPPLWRELAARPLLSVGGAAVLAVVIVTGEPLLPRRQVALPAVAAVAAAAAVFLYRRARPDAGRDRGLPPGSLGFGTSLDAITDLTFYATAAKRWGPVFKMAQFHRPVVCVVDLPLGLRVMDTERANLIQPRLPFGRLSPDNYIEFMNDEQHTRYRGILRSALSGRVIADARPGVESVIVHRFTAMVRPDGQGVDPDPFLDQIAFASLVRVMFGVAVEDPRVADLRRWFDDLGSSRAFVERRPEERQGPYAHLIAIVRGLGGDRLAQLAGPGPSARSVLGEVLQANPSHLADDTLIGNLVLMVHVTRSNIRGLLGWTLKEYCDHPDWAERFAAPTGADRAGSVDAMATNFVNEVLRMHQSEYFYREVVREIAIGEYRVPPGWLVRICVRECHDRPDLFPDPARFDPTRFADRHFDRTEYCPFSDGAHSCFGAGLAIAIARNMVLALAAQFEVRGTADGPVVRQGNRHWSHWRPSLAFRVAVTRRAQPVRTLSSPEG